MFQLLERQSLLTRLMDFLFAYERERLTIYPDDLIVVRQYQERLERTGLTDYIPSSASKPKKCALVLDATRLKTPTRLHNVEIGA